MHTCMCELYLCVCIYVYTCMSEGMYMCVYIHMYLYMNECILNLCIFVWVLTCQWKKVVRSPEAGAAGGCEPPNMLFSAA